jgi:hypothetical protein
MSDTFTRDDYAELLQRLRAATDDDATAILSNNFNVVLGALDALPLIRAQVLEEAAAAAETRDLGDHSPQDGLAQEIAAAIRALASRPANPT